MKILNLISGPRNISTALMYSFAQRADTKVWDEPFYAVYLIKSGAEHPGREEVLKSQPHDEVTVKNSIHSNRERRVQFIKNMAHHMEFLDEPFLGKAVNIFLIRNPHQIIASYAEVIQQPVMRDIGVQYQYEFFRVLQDLGQPSVVVDSGLLLENPREVLTKLCSACGIPFDESMLSWENGPKPYDGVWAPHWYTNVHASTGFLKQPTSSRPLPQALLPLYEEAMRFYEKLLPFSLKA